MHSSAGARVLSTAGLARLRHAAAMAPRLLGLDLGTVADEFERYFAPLQHEELPRIGAAVPLLRLEAESE